MLGVPADFDPAPLIGAVLFQVCGGEHELILRFDRHVSVTVEGDLVVRSGDTDVRGAPSAEAVALIMGFLSREIVAIQHDPGSVTFEFPNGSVQLLDSERHYESFQIQIGDVSIVV